MEPLPKPPHASSLAVVAVMKGNSRHSSQPEIALRSELHRRGLRYRVGARPDQTLNCRADAVFPSLRIAVFADGCFWHGCPEHGVHPRTNSDYWDAKIASNIARDRRNDEALTSAGWTVVRVWEHEPPEDAAERISRLVREKRAQIRDRPSTSAPRG